MAIFDKTGTLTLGKPVLQGDYDQGALQMAASLASQSAHPLSKAIVNAYEGALLNIENIEEISGQGLQGQCEGQVVKLGSRNWCGIDGESQSNDLELWYRKDADAPICFTLKDILRQDAKAVLEKFNQDNVGTILLSGDRAAVAKDIAAASGIETYYAEKKPTEKFDILEDYKAKGHSVLMVGDGLNDAPVLAAADVSIAPGTAIDMAQNAADIVFMGEKLAPVYEAYEIAKLSQKLVRQNFALAIVYNICVIPMAVAGMVTPMIAALAMSGSSLVVIANSFRIKWRA